MDFDHLVMPDDHIAMLTLGVAYDTLPPFWQAFDAILMDAAEAFGLHNPMDEV